MGGILGFQFHRKALDRSAEKVNAESKIFKITEKTNKKPKQIHVKRNASHNIHWH